MTAAERAAIKYAASGTTCVFCSWRYVLFLVLLRSSLLLSLARFLVSLSPDSFVARRLCVGVGICLCVTKSVCSFWVFVCFLLAASLRTRKRLCSSRFLQAQAAIFFWSHLGARLTACCCRADRFSDALELAHAVGVSDVLRAYVNVAQAFAATRDLAWLSPLNTAGASVVLLSSCELRCALRWPLHPFAVRSCFCVSCYAARTMRGCRHAAAFWFCFSHTVPVANLIGYRWLNAAASRPITLEPI